MLVLGADAAWGEFCGNGSRACAAYLFSRYPQYKEFYLTIGDKDYQIFRHQEGIFSIKLDAPKFELNKKFLLNQTSFETDQGIHFLVFNEKPIFYTEVIEPHLIVQEALHDEELFALGKELNARKDLFPQGINVNSCAVLDSHSLYVKTYERGVQRLTRSCGTGSSASAAVYLQGKPGAVRVTTPGGSLEIAMDSLGLTLKGPASFHTPPPARKEPSGWE